MISPDGTAAPALAVERPPRIALDLFRGLAAFLVLLSHVRGSAFVEFGSLPASQQTTATALFFGLTRIGGEAVLIFFVLSGYLVGGQIIHRSRLGRFDTLRYAVDRATRILIPLVPAVLLTVAVNYFLFAERPDYFQAFVPILGLNGVVAPTLERNAPLWSLAYEIWFYIAGGAAGHLLSRGRDGIVAFGLLSCALLVFSILDARLALSWGLGACVAIVAVTWSTSLGLCLIGAPLALTGLAFHQLSVVSKSLPNLSFMTPVMSESLICIGFALTLPFATSDVADRSLRWLARPAVLVSQFSFTLYLIHNPVNAAIDLILSDARASSISVNSLTSFWTRILVCVIVSYMFYWMFEKHTDRVRGAMLRMFNHTRLIHKRSLIQRLG